MASIPGPSYTACSTIGKKLIVRYELLLLQFTIAHSAMEEFIIFYDKNQNIKTTKNIDFFNTGGSLYLQQNLQLKVMKIWWRYLVTELLCVNT